MGSKKKKKKRNSEQAFENGFPISSLEITQHCHVIIDEVVIIYEQCYEQSLKMISLHLPVKLLSFSKFLLLNFMACSNH